MKKRYTEEQIIRILWEAETGATVTSICRQYGIAEATFYHCMSGTDIGGTPYWLTL